jgi:sulfatase modifying factor 1
MTGKNKHIILFFSCFFLFIWIYGQTDTDFTLVRKGDYFIGKKGFLENPYRKITTGNFFIARAETTNSEFEKFVTVTSYVTDAERLHNGMVFQPGLKEFEWLHDSTAYWRYPNGVSRGGIENKMNHPVTCISYTDIQAYCTWAGVRLPSLDEWEIACRAGSCTDYFFGSNEDEIKQYANIWNGRNHLIADSGDGYMYTSPVRSFKPNAWGLYDMYGNVFEFCSGSVKENESSSIAHARGGSWWCSRNACNFFNSYNIGRVNIHASFSNQGFRVVKN